ncbi:MAG: co-chaperone GroES [Chloroflexi bacterium]|nr:co-chaperone GroES [Chloroflexota bacterium]
MAIVPLGDRIVVKTIEEERTTASGLVLPDTSKERPQEGEVVAVGSGRITDEGRRLPIDLAAGDRVLFARYAGTEIKQDGTEYLILREADILAKKLS